MSMDPRDMHLPPGANSRSAVNSFALDDSEWLLNQYGPWQPLFASAAHQLPQQAVAAPNGSWSADQLLHHVQLLQSQLNHAQMQLQLASFPPPQMKPSDREYIERSQLREQAICHPNRVGKAYCAWHGTARIKSNKTPDPGNLSCDCPLKEALFEEALARHGVGSVKTGPERVHPDIRRALLQLLEKCFNYRDGDFDVDPATGQWIPGQTPHDWARRAARAANSPPPAETR
ncbi:hypothetical protein BKA62DRAFT_707465 [Auriculariales sp. MPI-PUGE-AT-0066]|nr:hypothetical protein BKA62DRAFT_707465 [Auriculariales sp. MPI-PUGE-AT-0066]